MASGKIGVAITGAVALASLAATAGTLPSTTATTTNHRQMVDGLAIFYREAGPQGRADDRAAARLSVVVARGSTR